MPARADAVPARGSSDAFLYHHGREHTAFPRDSRRSGKDYSPSEGGPDDMRGRDSGWLPWAPGKRGGGGGCNVDGIPCDMAKGSGEKAWSVCAQHVVAYFAAGPYGGGGGGASGDN